MPTLTSFFSFLLFPMCRCLNGIFSSYTWNILIIFSVSESSFITVLGCVKNSFSEKFDL